MLVALVRGAIGLVPAKARPLLVAIIAIVICLLLLRPRRKATTPRAAGRTQPAGRAHTAGGSSIHSVDSNRVKTSISTVGVLLEFRDNRPHLLPGAAAALRELVARANASVYLVTQLPADSDELEEAVSDELKRAGIFGGEGACDARKVMYCCTEDGRGAICRQLAPAVHLDTSHKVLEYLAPLLPRVYLVGDAGASSASSSRSATLHRVVNLADYAGLASRAAAAPAGA